MRVRESLKVGVRPAGLQDLDTLVSFNEALAWETEHRRLEVSRLRSGIETLLQDVRKGWYIVAEITPQKDPPPLIVGQMLVTFEWSDWRNGNFWWLQSVYVHPNYRGRGVFKELHAYVLHEARSRNEAVCGFRLYVERNNGIAHQTYGQIGFQETPYRIYEYELPNDSGSSSKREA